MDVILKTEHIEIQEGVSKGRLFYITWFYENGRKLYGFQRYHDLPAAVDAAIKYMEVTGYGSNISTTEGTGEAGQSR